MSDTTAIDVAVHRHVLGWPCEQRDGWGPWVIRRPYLYADGSPVFDPIPHYTRDLNEAWRVVEVMAAAGWRLTLTDCRGRETQVGWHARFGTTYQDASVADTAPLAICLAALVAKGVPT